MTVDTAVKTRNWKGTGRPTAAEPAVTNAAALSIPSAAVRVKISATANTPAMINQISHGSIARPLSPARPRKGLLHPFYPHREDRYS
ncbi:hypothetical protein PV963_02225 [Streptomyces coeruleorubidus]|uniref:hypothetical protein n=1 Tax=Streptomyces coeruleorubidus TaxID=116188 RepID=UPI00237F4087|nr:hypothetical protein [Streptomyces coeruleorubidus]WDV57070.1 hypothetical protein PV963_02225 [Streptomyces coeruleorubidus]